MVMPMTYLQAALHSGIAGRSADVPRSQHARSNASQTPLESAGGDGCVFLQTGSLLIQVTDSMTAAHACLLDYSPVHFEQCLGGVVVLAHPAPVSELLPALPAAVKLPAAGPAPESGRRQRAPGSARGGLAFGCCQCVAVCACF